MLSIVEHGKIQSVALRNDQFGERTFVTIEDSHGSYETFQCNGYFKEIKHGMNVTVTLDIECEEESGEE